MDIHHYCLIYNLFYVLLSGQYSRMSGYFFLEKSSSGFALFTKRHKVTFKALFLNS